MPRDMKKDAPKLDDQLTFEVIFPKTPPPDPNPLVRLLGPGPAKARCKTCIHLAVRVFSKRYYKCELRGITGSKKTDHLVGYNACSKYATEQDRPALAENVHIEQGHYRNFCDGGAGAERVNACRPAEPEPPDSEKASPAPGT